MKVSQRLFLGVVPSVVGLFTVAGLAYWGKYSRTAPEAVVIVAGIASVISLVVAWRNTRYVARRVERLASIRSSAGRGENDERDAIEQKVDFLGREASAARADADKASRDALNRAKEYAAMVTDAAGSVSERLSDARLSLHVLQENHFGELNDNQEEIINAARDQVEAAETELGKLKTIASIDQGAIIPHPQATRVSDVVRSLLPLVKSRAEKKNIRLMSEIDPAIPRISCDKSKLRDALMLVLNDAVTYAVPGTSLSIHLSGEKNEVALIINHGSPHSSTSDMALAQRLIGIQGGSVTNEGDATVVRLVRERVSS